MRVVVAIAHPRVHSRFAREHCVLLGVLLLLCLVSVTAHAQTAGSTATNSNYTSIIDLFNTAASHWQAPLQSAASALFGGLVAINLVLTVAPLTVRGADFPEWAETLVKFVLVTGFWLWMIHNYSSLANSVIQGFRHAAQNAVASSGGSSTLTPTDILKCGVDLANVALQQASLWRPVLTVAIAITACIIFCIFGLVAGLVAVTLVESFVVVNASVIFMALGAFRFTSEIAMHAIKYTLGVGVKLFSLQLIVGVSLSVFEGWTIQYSAPGMLATVQDIFGLACLIILIFFLALHVPPALMGIVTGSHGLGPQMGTMVATGSAIVAGGATMGAGAAGAGMAVHGASRLASEQLKSSELSGTAPRTALGRIAALTGHAVGNLATAAARDAGARLGGRAGASEGTMGGRMGESMRSHADAMRSERTKPALPAAPSSTPGSGPSTSTPVEPPRPPPSSPSGANEGGAIRGEGVQL
jgi:type IV secretion system protein TrbL